MTDIVARDERRLIPVLSSYIQASLADDDDCVKFFLCELGSRLEGAVTDFEAMVGGMFDASSSSSSSYDLDSGAAPSAAAPSAAAAAKFRLAAALGRYVLRYGILYRYILLTLIPGAAAPASVRAHTASAIGTTDYCSKRSGARCGFFYFSKKG